MAEYNAEPVRVPTVTPFVSPERMVLVFAVVHPSEDGRGEQSSSLGPTTVHTWQPEENKSAL